MKNLDSISIDHSTSDQDYHSKESLNVLVQTMSHSRDGEPTPDNNNGSSMRSQRPSRTTTGSLTHLISNQTEVQPTSDVLPLILDGGKCGDSKIAMLPVKRAKFWKYKEVLIVKTEILLSIQRKIMKSTNNGISSMLMNGRESQQRDNLMRDSDFMSKEISTLFQSFHRTDT